MSRQSPQATSALPEDVQRQLAESQDQIAAALAGLPENVQRLLADVSLPEELEAAIEAHPELAETPDGRRAVSGSRDQTLKVWDLESGVSKAARTLTEPLQMIMDNGTKRVLIPLSNRRQMLEIPLDVLQRVDTIFYSEPLDTALKALGMS